MVHFRWAKVRGKKYLFSLEEDSFGCVCEVQHRGKIIMQFEYSSSRYTPGKAKQQFDADIDALIAAGGTREAMTRFVFGNVMEQKESRNE